MASKPFNVAIVGYGLSAKVFHIPLILALPSDFSLYGIVQRTPRAEDDVSKDHPGAKSWRSINEVYHDPNVDVVVITSTPETHYVMCKESLEAGKHVVVEKPFVPTSREASELIYIAQKCGKLLTVYQNRRWDNDYLTFRRLLAENALGEIVEFETHFDRYRPDPPPAGNWKGKDGPASGSIYDLGTHLIDQVYHSFGLPKAVTAFVGIQRQSVTGGPHDSFTILLHYGERTLATIKAGVTSIEEAQLKFWVKGTKGSFQKFYLDTQEDQLKAGTIRPGDKDFGLDPESHYGTLTTIEHDKPVKKTYPSVEPQTYVEFYRLFARALRGEGVVPVKPEDARDVLRIIEAALTSSREKKTISP